VQTAAPLKVDRRRRLKHDPASIPCTVRFSTESTPEQMAACFEYFRPLLRFRTTNQAKG
jgi:hypothetical protein